MRDYSEISINFNRQLNNLLDAASKNKWDAAIAAAGEMQTLSVEVSESLHASKSASAQKFRLPLDNKLVEMYRAGMLPQEIADKQDTELWLVVERILFLGEEQPLQPDHAVFGLIEQQLPVQLHENSMEYPALLDLMRKSPYRFIKSQSRWIYNAML